MNKSSIICPSCDTDNLADAEFCTNCGTSLSDTPKEAVAQIPEEQDIHTEYQNWLRSVPYTAAAALFLVFLDLVTSPGIQWSYWPAVPIILFAIIAPYFSFKLGGA